MIKRFAIILFSTIALTLPMRSSAQKMPSAQLQVGPYEVGAGGKYQWIPDSELLSFRVARQFVIVDADLNREVFRGDLEAEDYRWLDSNSIIAITNDWSGEKGLRRRMVKIEHYSINIGSNVLSLDSTSVNVAHNLKRAGFSRSTFGNTTIASHDLITKVFPIIKKNPRRSLQKELFVQALIEPGQGLDSPRNLQLVDIQGNIHSTIATNTAYFFPRLSPSGDMVSCHQNADLALITTEGEVITLLKNVAGDDWASNGRSVYFNRPEEDGHNIVGSELFVYSIDTDSEFQLTLTEHVIELYPVASGTEKHVAYHNHLPAGNRIEILKTGGGK